MIGNENGSLAWNSAVTLFVYCFWNQSCEEKVWNTLIAAIITAIHLCYISTNNITGFCLSFHFAICLVICGICVFRRWKNIQEKNDRKSMHDFQFFWKLWWFLVTLRIIICSVKMWSKSFYVHLHSLDKFTIKFGLLTLYFTGYRLFFPFPHHRSKKPRPGSPILPLYHLLCHRSCQDLSPTEPASSSLAETPTQPTWAPSAQCQGEAACQSRSMFNSSKYWKAG